MPKTRVVNLRTEAYDIYIGRPSRWGNPCKIGPDGDRDQVIAKFRVYLDGHPELVALGKKQLQGKILGCYCKPAPCHGDVWAEILDNEVPE